MKKIHILFVSHSSGLYGAERGLLTLLQHLNRNKFEPIVALPGPGPLRDKIDQLNIKNYLIDLPWWIRTNRNFLAMPYALLKEMLAQLKLRRIILKEDVELVFTNSIVICAGAIAARLTNRPHLWYIKEIFADNPDLHGLIPNTLIFRIVKRLSTRVLTVSNAVGSQFCSEQTCGLVRTVYEGIDARPFVKVNSPIKKLDGISENDWPIAVIGTLQRRKAQKEAIQAANIARKSIPNLKLLLIGKSDPAYEHHLREVVDELGCHELVRFLGHREDIIQLLKHIKILLVPSWNEPSGIVLFEAMASGLPVLGAFAGGIPEIIVDGVTGLLAPPHNPEALAEKIVELFSDETKLRQMGRLGQKRLLSHFSVDRHVQCIERAIEEVTTASVSSPSLSEPEK